MEVNPFYSDEAVVTALCTRQGMEPAVRFLYRQHYDALSHYTLQNSGSQQDAEDVFQEVIVTFLELVNKGKFRGEASIRTFLYSLNRHIWLNELKKRGRMQARNLKFEQSRDQSDADAAAIIAGREGRQQIMELIEQLGEACKQVLIAFYYQELSVREMLASLPYENEQVIRNKKYKCMKKLEEMLHNDPALANNLKTILSYEH